jgi:1,2-diacylglycerol 3-beta-glucosyltransferase
MRNWIIGVAIVLLIMLSGLYIGLYNMRVDWLQMIMVAFTIYGVFMILVSSITRRRKLEPDKSYRPYISIIVPARNEEFVIAKTVRSLMKLDYYTEGKPHFEVIVMDDNSSDQTLKNANALLNEYEKSQGDTPGTG